MRGEKVLMYDGNIKKVEDIKLGELVMGDDSTPRTVLETHSGTDKMYKVTNRRGDSYTVNSHHSTVGTTVSVLILIGVCSLVTRPCLLTNPYARSSLMMKPLAIPFL
jgi:hypothetical protein